MMFILMTMMMMMISVITTRVPRVGGSEHSASLVEQQLVFRRPTVWIDTVKNVSGVVVDCAKSAYDSETLVARRLDTRHTLVECSLYQYSTRLTQRCQLKICLNLWVVSRY